MPRLVAQSERIRQFAAAKPGRNTHVGVMQSDVVGAEERSERAVEDLGNSSPLRFACDDHARVVNPSAKFAQLDIGELVEDKIADDDTVGAVATKGSQVLAMPRHTFWPSDRSRPQVESRHFHSAARQPLTELAGARADLEQSITVAKQGRQGTFQPAVGAEHAICKPKIAPVVQRRRMIVRQRVEQFGLKRTLHRRRPG